VGKWSTKEGSEMSALYKNSFIPFATIMLCLLLCAPLLGAGMSTQASARPYVEDAIDARLKQAGLVNLREMDTSFDIELRYATSDNFTGTQLYNSQKAYLTPQTAKKLASANKEFISMGYRIKLFDAYRPLTVQKILYSYVSGHKTIYIANPYAKASNHNRGCAVDITLVRLDGTPVPMPTDFDTFESSASIYYRGATEQEKKYRELLASVMAKHGFKRLDIEWWHFDDTDAGKYPVLDIVF
jgi:D-alanyl-D-alanine dipeptidase